MRLELNEHQIKELYGLALKHKVSNNLIIKLSKAASCQDDISVYDMSELAMVFEYLLDKIPEEHPNVLEPVTVDMLGDLNNLFIKALDSADEDSVLSITQAQILDLLEVLNCASGVLKLEQSLASFLPTSREYVEDMFEWFTDLSNLPDDPIRLQILF